MSPLEAGGPSEKPHDVLAAEAFAMPTADPMLHHGPVAFPEDPSGIPEPHDVLAAEEFPMPAGDPRPRSGLMGPSPARKRTAGALAGLIGLVLIARVLRRR